MHLHIMSQHMSCIGYTSLVPSLLLLFAILVVGDEELSPVRNTSSGPIQGYVHTLKDGRKVERYLGVPFAAPPVGDSRFELPVAPRSWTDVRKTISVSAACMQSGLDPLYIKEHAPEYNGSMSEDCLYLNIYTPQRQDSTLLPVLIHVHGGSNVVGMGAMLHADVLASRGNLVVVTFNYRLAVFGFLHVPHLDILGNFGLHDQLMTFKWVQQNIDQFGGDPSKVTIQGHSAGGVDVGIHVLSPASAGLFRYAILQSGAPTSYWAILPGPDLNDLSKGPLHHVSDIGCPHEDKKRALSCLKSIDATKLSTKIFIHGSGFYHFSPTVDDFFLNEHPLKLLEGLSRGQTGTVNAEAVLLGVVKNEGAQTANIIRQEALKQEVLKTSIVPNATQMPDHFNDQHFKVFPESIVSQYKKMDNFEELIYFAYKPWSDPRNVTANFISLSDLVGDVTFTAPTVQTANYLMRSNRSQVYLYSFEHRAPMSAYPDWMGIPHGDDLFYVLGCPVEGHPLRNYTDLDRSVSLALIDLWAHFVTHGNPSYDNFSFQAYSDEQNHILISSNDSGAVIRQDARLRAREMVLWNRLVTFVKKGVPETPDRTDRREVVTWILATFLCVVIVASLAAILCLCRKIMSQRRHVKQAGKM
ncbi:hypothetical protein BsWGS_02452 [Bradybaena similaris]